MEAIKLKLSQNEVGGLIRHLSALPETWDLKNVLLAEFQVYVWKRFTAQKLDNKKQALYRFPVSVAVALWLLWYRDKHIETVLLGVLAQIDQALTNRGMKQCQNRNLTR